MMISTQKGVQELGQDHHRRRQHDQHHHRNHQINNDEQQQKSSFNLLGEHHDEADEQRPLAGQLDKGRFREENCEHTTSPPSLPPTP